jgi:hypothetical protein
MACGPRAAVAPMAVLPSGPCASSSTLLSEAKPTRRSGARSKIGAWPRKLQPTVTKASEPVRPDSSSTLRITPSRDVDRPMRSGRRNRSLEPANMRRGKGMGALKPPRSGCPSGPSPE